MITVQLDENVVKSLTEGFLTKKVLDLRGKKESFTVAELLGPCWPDETEPFYTMYGGGRTSGQAMGKLLKRVTTNLGLRASKEVKHGRDNGITRYHF